MALMRARSPIAIRKWRFARPPHRQGSLVIVHPEDRDLWALKLKRFRVDDQSVCVEVQYQAFTLGLVRGGHCPTDEPAQGIPITRISIRSALTKRFEARPDEECDLGTRLRSPHVDLRVVHNKDDRLHLASGQRREQRRILGGDSIGSSHPRIMPVPARLPGLLVRQSPTCHGRVCRLPSSPKA
jgi:hypothetical protein